jgi:NAD(P)-dependent dehydrogenase (short-subunit alcohol dehydrogenase family)
MQRQRSGCIVITSSGHAFYTYPKYAAYATTKAGLLGLTRALAIDYAPDGIRVNCIIPGATETPLLRLHINASPDPKAEEQRILAKIPAGRFAQPEDIAKGVRFLASEDAAYVTGTWFAVDGGLMAHG